MTTNRDRRTIENLPGPALVALWNELHPEKPVRRFATRQAGVDRVLRALEEREAAQPAQREPAAAPASRRAPRAARRSEHVPTGEVRPPRPGTKRAALLARLLGEGASAEEIGSEFSWKPNDVRDALRLLAAQNGFVTYVGEDGRWHAAEPETDPSGMVVVVPAPEPEARAAAQPGPKRSRRAR